MAIASGDFGLPSWRQKIVSHALTLGRTDPTDVQPAAGNQLRVGERILSELSRRS